MAHSNPGFSQSPAFSNNSGDLAKWRQEQNSGLSLAKQSMTAEQLQELYSQPSASPVDTDRMTYEDTIAKTFGAFAVLLVSAAIGWFVPQLTIVGALVGFVLAMVNIFKKRPSAALVLLYAGFEGVFVGGISKYFEAAYDGIVVQAILGTLGVFAVTLALFASGKVRASKRATQIFLVAIVGYAAFSLINFVLQLTGVTSGQFGLRSIEFLGIPLGFWIGIVVVLLAAYSLVLDFTQIKTGVENGAPRIFGWQAAFGLVVTIVWLYTEILRMLAILRGNN